MTKATVVRHPGKLGQSFKAGTEAATMEESCLLTFYHLLAQPAFFFFL